MYISSHCSLNRRQSAGGTHPPTRQGPTHAWPGKPSWLRRVAQAIAWACLALAVSAATSARPPQHRDPQDAADRDPLLAFERNSAPELVDHYFDLPSAPILVIRRLIYLGDPRVIPALRAAFDRQREPLPREFIAAALVRLGETDPVYFNNIAGAARDALEADLPYDSSLAAVVAKSSVLQGQEEIQAWAQAHNVSAAEALYRATIEIPGAVEALALTADKRSVPILLLALRSPNFLVVREGALGLGRMREASAIGPIIAACQRLGPEDRPWIAKSLLYFPSRKARDAARSIIVDPARLQLWSEDVRREETRRNDVASLSKAVQWLDQASIQLDQFDQAFKQGNSAEARRALKRYIRDVGFGRRDLARLSGGTAEDGLAGAVLPRTEAQRTRFEKVRKAASGVRGRAEKEAEAQLAAASRMMQTKVIRPEASANPKPSVLER